MPLYIFQFSFFHSTFWYFTSEDFLLVWWRWYIEFVIFNIADDRIVDLVIFHFTFVPLSLNSILEFFVTFLASVTRVRLVEALQFGLNGFPFVNNWSTTDGKMYSKKFSSQYNIKLELEVSIFKLEKTKISKPLIFGITAHMRTYRDWATTTIE